MHDEEDYAKQLQWILYATVIFVVSGYAAWTEFRFLVWGRQAEAMIERAREDVDGEDLTLSYIPGRE